jgi:hypothetical protein
LLDYAGAAHTRNIMKNTPDPKRLDGDHAEAMEVHGFDLLAQVEAMLRCVRAYQHNVQELRSSPLTPAIRRKSADAVLDNVKQLRTACDTFCTGLDDVVARLGEAPRRLGRVKG